MNLPRISTLLLLSSCLLPAKEDDPLQEYTLFARFDDRGQVFINGNPIAKADRYKDLVEQKIWLRKGDIITVKVEDTLGGIGGLLIRVVKGDRDIAGSKDFFYSVDPDPGWQTTDSMIKFKTSQLEKRKGVTLGNVAEPVGAWSKGEDKKFATAYFKCVFFPGF